MKNRKKKLGVIGASYLQLPLVKKALELDMETHCFAYGEGAVCREFCTSFYPISILEKEAILQICKEIGIDGILTIASDIGVPTVNFVAEELKLVGNSVSSSLICTNKYLMKKTLSAQGFRVAKFLSVPNINELDKAASLKYPLIVKPADRSGSLGVTRIDSAAEIKGAYETAFECSLNKEVVLEEFIEGFELSIESISMNNSHHILALTDKVTTGSPHFVELEHHQPSTVSSKLKKEILEIIPQALSTLQIQVGAAHSEVIVNKNGEIFINEIGARMGGDFIGSHLVKLSTGYDYLRGVIEAALGIDDVPEIKTQMHSGVIFLSPENEAYFTRLDPNKPFIVEYVSPSTKIKRKFTKSGDRNGYFIYQSNKKIEFAEI